MVVTKYSWGSHSLKSEDKVEKNRCWACYHSDLYSFDIDGRMVGIIPCAVGAPYAVLVAEQLFVSGCEILVSVTSAGIINPPAINKRFALITEAVRDEGTSYHYLPDNVPSLVSHDLFERLKSDSEDMESLWFEAKSWTTDAPYRETETAIMAMKKDNVTCVEMEAAALYAFAKTKNKNVVCFAHLTNTMAQQEGDFEKGESFGSVAMLDLIVEVLKKLEQ